MNRTRLDIFLIMSSFLLFIPTILFAFPTEESLIETWEGFQKSDPKTLIFEKLSGNRYRFKTERFPFDGELKKYRIKESFKLFSAESKLKYKTKFEEVSRIVMGSIDGLVNERYRRQNTEYL